jgi:universal stress protein A
MFTFKTMLCPVDFSEPSFRALLKASEIAGPNSELYLLHVVSSTEPAGSEVNAVKNLHDLIRDYLPESLNAHALVGAGNATNEILRVAVEKNVDLIIMATHGSTGWREFVLGSVTDEVVRMAPCPVLTISDVARRHADSGKVQSVPDRTAAR